MSKTPLVLLLGLIVCGCETDVDFDLKQAPDVLVVDASIENGKPPVVVLTKSMNFFSSINPAIIAGTFVHDAKITMSNGRLTHQLKEYVLPFAAGIDFYVYSVDSADLATAFDGEFNTSYSLSILAGGQEYHASTTIPVLAKKPDSLWWKTAPYQEDTSKIVVMVKATDPPGLGNYVRYFTQKNSERFLPGENSVFDDQVIDGATYELQLQPGVDRNNPVPRDDNYFHHGDTVTLKLCNIDRLSYLFWNTWEYTYQSIGNPFGQPGKVLGNISNGALGAFYGYASAYKTIIIPK